MHGWDYDPVFRGGETKSLIPVSLPENIAQSGFVDLGGLSKLEGIVTLNQQIDYGSLHVDAGYCPG